MNAGINRKLKESYATIIKADKSGEALVIIGQNCLKDKINLLKQTILLC